MSKKLHVCVDGLNLALTRGTGIATYARNLCNHLHQAGYKVSLLFDKRLNDSASDLLYEVAFYESISKLSEKESLPRRTFRHLSLFPFYIFKTIIYFLKSPKAKERLFPGIVEAGEMKKKLPAFDTTYNIWRLYRVAQCYFFVFGRLLPIKLNPTPDVMHWTCPIPARVVGAKNYYTVHDLIPLRLPYATKDNKKFFYHMLLQIVKTADKLITVSECSRQDIMTYLHVAPEKIINTYQDVCLSDIWSVDKQNFSVNQLKVQFDLAPQSYFLFVGAIEPKKNVLRLLEGYLSANVTQKMIVVGPLAWQSDREQEVLGQYPDRILYLRYVSSDTLATLLRHARALVFPSIFEGFGLPVVEAMSLGTPVITSNTSSLAEIAQDAAYLVDPYNVGEISAAIYRLATEDDLCATLSMKSKERAQRFNSEAYSLRLKNVYKEQ